MTVEIKASARSLKSLIATMLLTCLTSAPASAARMANAVEKSVSLSGRAAKAVAELFGLSAPEHRCVLLKLGRMDAWAVYLLKKDTALELSNDNNGSPARYNTVEFVDAASPSLQIHPFWMDLATRAPNPSAGEYSFGSPFISEKLTENDPWTQLLKTLKQQKDWNQSRPTQFKRTYNFSNDGRLSIEILSNHDYSTNQDGHLVFLTVRPAKSK